MAQNSNGMIDALVENKSGEKERLNVVRTISGIKDIEGIIGLKAA